MKHRVKRDKYINVRCTDYVRNLLTDSLKAFDYMTQADVVELALYDFYEKYHVAEILEKEVNA